MRLEWQAFELLLVLLLPPERASERSSRERVDFFIWVLVVNYSVETCIPET